MKTMTDTISAFGKYRYNIFAILLAAGFIACQVPSGAEHGAEETSTKQEMIIDSYLQEIMGKEVKDMNPDVVGEHIIFNEKWLEALEIVRVELGMSKEDALKGFITWRDRMDKVYECYKELTGTDTYYGNVIYVDYIEETEWHNGVHSHTECNRVCSNKVAAVVEITFALRDNAWDYGMVHEISHQFDNERPWHMDGESMANLKMAYACEKYGVRLNDFYEEKEWYENEEFRKFEMELCHRNLDELEIADADCRPSKLKMYNYGLVEEFDWDVFKKFYRENKNYTSETIRTVFNLYKHSNYPTVVPE